MSMKRNYDDGCAGAHALNLVGERWALPVVRELILGPKRFTDLRDGLPRISPNVLKQRLTELEAAAVLVRRRLPPPGNTQVYELTDWGRELEIVIVELGRWGARSPALPRDAPLSVDSLILSFRTMFDEEAAAGVRASLELRFGEQRFRADVAHGRLTIERGAAAHPDVRIASDPDTLAGLAYDGQKLGNAIDAGRVVLDGDRGVAKRFFKLFTLPPPAPASEQLART